MQKPSLYHILTTPESINSVIELGDFPKDIPNYVFPNQLVLHKAFERELPQTHTNTNQSFIVEVNMPSAHLKPIPKNSITRIFVYSSTAKSRLQNLLKTPFNKPIIVTPTLFSAWNSDNTHSSVEKKLLTNLNLPEPPIGIDSILSTQSPLLANRLCTIEEHISFIKNAFLTVKKEIFITSCRLDSETFKVLNLFTLIQTAREKGISLHFYYSDKSDSDLDLMQFLFEQNVVIKQSFTLSKILMIDNRSIAIGSFDWLCALREQDSVACDGTIVLTGSIDNIIFEDFQNNLKDACDFFTDTFPTNKKLRLIKPNTTTQYYRFQPDSLLAHISTTDGYKLHYVQSLQMAKKNIIICTPIITNFFLQNTDLKQLHYLDQNKVELIFICNKNDPKLKKFIDYLSYIGSTHIHVLTMNNLHLNTIIVDDNRISEGSFNWLSQEKQHHSTIEVSGDLAKNMVEQFYTSAVGKIIMEYIFSLPLSEPNSDEDDFYETNKLC